MGNFCSECGKQKETSNPFEPLQRNFVSFQPVVPGMYVLSHHAKFKCVLIEIIGNQIHKSYFTSSDQVEYINATILGRWIPLNHDYSQWEGFGRGFDAYADPESGMKVCVEYEYLANRKLGLQYRLYQDGTAYLVSHVRLGWNTFRGSKAEYDYLMSKISIPKSNLSQALCS